MENATVVTCCERENKTQLTGWFARAYRGFALLFLNAVAFALLVLVACDIFVPDPRSDKREYFVNVFKPQFYSTVSSDRVREIALDHSYYQFFKGLIVVHPWTGFPTNRPIELTTIHVDELGRRYNPAKDETKRNGESITIWFFGGSTMFGWGMPDELTIPEVTRRKLQERFPDKRISVVNFGVPYYNSAHELALFTAHLRHEAEKPDIAVFFDGLNDYAHSVLFGDPDSHFKTAQSSFNEWDWMKNDTHWFSLGPGFPIWKLQTLLAEMFASPPQAQPPVPSSASPQGPDEAVFTERARAGVRWYQFNQKAELRLAKQNGVQAYFVNQPQGPFYNPPTYLNYFFKSMKEGSPRGRFLDQLHLLDPILAKNQAVHVDSAGHYNDVATDLIAADLASFLEKRYLAGRAKRQARNRSA